MIRNLSKMLKAQEAADYLGVHVKTLHRWSNAGDIATYRTPGNQRRYHKADLDGFLKHMLSGKQTRERDPQ
jgi:excisionase family DNA binding protein